VQLDSVCVLAQNVDLFQSSPVPKDGCNAGSGTPVPIARVFQSSPVPKDGCN